jgi:hypothetical protein
MQSESLQLLQVNKSCMDNNNRMDLWLAEDLNLAINVKETGKQGSSQETDILPDGRQTILLILFHFNSVHIF